MRFIKTSDSNASTIAETYYLSISDLMASLLIIFILTLAYYMLTYSLATAKLQENVDIKKEILRTIQKELKKQGVIVKIDENLGVLRLPEGILFDQGSAKIKKYGEEVIQKLSPILYKTLSMDKYRGSVETVFIEGHTDNTPIGGVLRHKYPSNWELSAQRAINTWNKMIAISSQLDELRNKKMQHVFSCGGYADTRPVCNEDTKACKKENRRIDLRFSMTPPRKEEESAITEIEKHLK